MDTPAPEHDRHLDEATSRRLGKLGQVPFDTSKLKARVDAGVEGLRPRELSRPTRRVAVLTAAAIATALIVGVALWPRNNAVVASPATLAQVHEEVLTGHTHATQVASFDAARNVLAEEWPEGPKLPDLRGDQALSCCVCEVEQRKVACILFQVDGVKCSLAVGKAVDLRADGGGEAREIRGVKYRVQSHGTVNILVTNHDDRWLCLMSELPITRLAEVADALRL